MVPSDDYWRHNSPWPGHDAQLPGHAPGEPPPSTNGPMPLINPPPASPWGGNTGWAPPLGGSTGGFAGGYSSTGCGGGIAVVGFVVFFWAVPKALPLLVALYPLVAAIEIGAARGVFLLLGKLAPGAPSDTRLALAVAACLVLLWPASRLEQWLANYRAYRVARHIVRLALVAMLVYQLTSTMPLATPLPAWMHPLRGLFRSPAQLAAVVGAVVVMHLLLGNLLGVRDAWRRSLEAVRLRHA
ncbi:MAG: hypothetical protein JWO39_898 [Gemmatimonadetes bacterium]|nr:hypothetical protein [Gemmatimonadota bacterium]